METKPKLSSVGVMCEMTKLKAQQRYLEATQSSLDIYHKLSDKDASMFMEAHLLKTDLDNNLAAFKDTLKFALEDYFTAIKSFSETMLNLNGIQKYNTNEYRDQIILVDKKFRDILTENTNQCKKLQMDYGELEINAVPCPTLFHNYQKQCPKQVSNRKSHINRMQGDGSDNYDVKKFLDFLTATNGHTGGWISEEHNLYVKLKNKYKTNIEQIIMSIQHILPGIINYL